MSIETDIMGTSIVPVFVFGIIGFISLLMYTFRD